MQNPAFPGNNEWRKWRGNNESNQLRHVFNKCLKCQKRKGHKKVNTNNRTHVRNFNKHIELMKSLEQDIEYEEIKSIDKFFNIE